MSNFLIFKATFNNSSTPAIGTYTAEGASAAFNQNSNYGSSDYYLCNYNDNTAVQWFVPAKETTDFEFVADILTRDWTNRVTYFIIADSAGTTRLRMWSQYSNWTFENSDSTSGYGNPEYIGTINPYNAGGFGVFHQFRVRVHKLTETTSGVKVYVDGVLKLDATAQSSLITCAKLGFVGGAGTWGSGSSAGIKNVYIYDLSEKIVVDRGILSEAFNKFIAWNKNIFAAKADYIPRSGGAVMTGDLLASSTTHSLGFGYGWGNGGTIYTYSPTHSTVDWQGTVRLEPLKTTSYFKTMTLAPNGTWTWNGTACQITSDQRYKQQIAEIDDKLLDAWEDVELSQFKYNDAVEQKGKDKARLHTGYVVQQIDTACKSHNVDISEYGLFCHEEYPEETEEAEVEQKDGTKSKERKVIREADEHYSLRYTEALVVECAYLRKQIKELKERLEKLEGNSK